MPVLYAIRGDFRWKVNLVPQVCVRLLSRKSCLKLAKNLILNKETLDRLFLKEEVLSWRKLTTRGNETSLLMF